MREIVLISPPPLETVADLTPQLAGRNHQLRQYVIATERITSERGYPWIDLFRTDSNELTSNGVHLNAAGHRWLAREVCRQLGLGPRVAPVTRDDEKGELIPRQLEHLRQSIIAKNQLWFDYWRPMNWAFLHGDLTGRPSSRDHRDHNIRWFPDEMAQFLPLIATAEATIHQVGAALAALGPKTKSAYPSENDTPAGLRAALAPVGTPGKSIAIEAPPSDLRDGDKEGKFGRFGKRSL